MYYKLRRYFFRLNLAWMAFRVKPLVIGAVIMGGEGYWYHPQKGTLLINTNLSLPRNTLWVNTEVNSIVARE